MHAAIKRAAPLAALAAAAILAGCAAEPASYTPVADAYVYDGPSAVFYDDCCFYDRDYRHFNHYGPAFRGNGGGFHGGGGGFHGGGGHGGR
jgi:hypothetical protein